MRFARYKASTFACLALLGGGGLLGCATAPVASTSVPAPSEIAADYYPLSTGWKWAYDLEKEGEHILAIYKVVEREGDAAIVLAGEERLGYAVTPEGLARQKDGQITDFILKNPVKVGTVWTVVGGKAQVVAVGQTITLPSPAGTFTNCVTVEETRSDPERIVRTTFAAGVGPVSVELQMHDQATQKFITALRATLRGVTKPGEDPLGPEKK